MVSKKYMFTGNQFPVYERWKNPMLIYWKFSITSKYDTIKRRAAKGRRQERKRG